MNKDDPWWDVIKGYKGFHREVNDVVLGAFTTILGIMQTGKSTTINTIVRQINKEFKVPQINLLTKHFQDIFELHNTDLVDKLREVEMINIFCDDAITSMHSKGANRQKEINWYTIRHYFKEVVGLDVVVINAFFAAQRYKTLSLVLRQAPILIFKPTIIRDDYEEMFIRPILGAKGLKNIKKWAIDIYYNGEVKKMENCYIKVGDSKARQIIIPKTEGVNWIQIPHKDEAEGRATDRASLGTILHYLNTLTFEDMEQMAMKNGRKKPYSLKSLGEISGYSSEQVRNLLPTTTI